MHLEPTKQGLKLHENDKHIKTVPKKYKSVITRITFSSDGIRLNDQDRLFLEAELFRDRLKNSLTRTDQLTAERIEGSIIEDCVQIDLQDGHWESGETEIIDGEAVRPKPVFIHKKRFVLLWSNKVELTCNPSLFKLGTGEVQRKLY